MNSVTTPKLGPQPLIAKKRFGFSSSDNGKILPSASTVLAEESLSQIILYLLFPLKVIYLCKCPPSLERGLGLRNRFLLGRQSPVINVQQDNQIAVSQICHFNDCILCKSQAAPSRIT